jgi:REP element-mobilizing transposase RayT
MPFSRRHLPHWIPDQAAIFVTWRLASPNSFQEGCGPFWLQDSRVAGVVVDALLYGETVRHFYQLHAWAIMPNHVHVIFQPHAAMPAIMRWLKGRTSRLANRILGRTGTPFWQDESFDHWVRSAEELQDLIAYVENNPVKAGLVEAPEQWRWSSAGWMTDR